jgi:uncharacterized Tic20 family protein
MHNQPLTSSIRAKAVSAHLAGLTYIPICYLLSFHCDVTRYITFLGVPILAIFFATLLTALTCQINGRSHPFLRQSGNCAMNFFLSYSIYLMIVVALYFAAFSMFAETVGEKDIGLALLFAGGFIIVLLGTFLIHTCCILTGVMFTFQGKIYSYPLTIRFLNESP